MKGFSRILVILLTLCLLAGCGQQYPEGQTVQCKDLQITFPGDFADLSGESFAADADVMYGWRSLVVKGMAEEKAKLKTMTLAEYTALVISGNKLDCSPEGYGDGYRFTYEASVGDTVYTYVTATVEGQTHFWIFQFYGPKDKWVENQPEIDRILSGIRVLETK